MAKAAPVGHHARRGLMNTLSVNAIVPAKSFPKLECQVVNGVVFFSPATNPAIKPLSAVKENRQEQSAHDSPGWFKTEVAAGIGVG